MSEKDILKRILWGSLLLCERVGLDTGERKRINTSEKRIVLIFAGAGKRKNARGREKTRGEEKKTRGVAGRKYKTFTDTEKRETRAERG